MKYKALIIVSSLIFNMENLQAAEVTEKNLTLEYSLTPPTTMSEMPNPAICLPIPLREEPPAPVNSPVSSEDDSDLDKIYVGDKPYIHIINETDKNIPICLAMNVWDENKSPYSRLELDPVRKEVNAHSECSIMESECVLFKWCADAYKNVQPQNCTFNAMLIFNSGKWLHNSPQYFSGSVAPCLNLKTFVGGVTYKLIQNGQDSFEYIIVKPENNQKG